MREAMREASREAIRAAIRDAIRDAIIGIRYLPAVALGQWEGAPLVLRGGTLAQDC
jgi:hypothetical protein